VRWITERAQGLGLRDWTKAPRFAATAAAGVIIAAALSPQPLALRIALAQAQPQSPIIVKIIPPEEKSELSGLADVLLGSLGLTGAIVLAAVLMGALMAGVLFWVRSRSVE
jgi:hypothetical protein